MSAVMQRALRHLHASKVIRHERLARRTAPPVGLPRTPPKPPVATEPYCSSKVMGRNGMIQRAADAVARPPPVARPCDVFINHRGLDTKRTVAGLLYDRLFQLNIRPFLDNRTMEPGDKLFETIDSAIRDCKVGIAVFSPHYCESYFCLHELALLVESQKKMIPIFCDVKPSDLQVAYVDNLHPLDELERFRSALRAARYTVGLTFDSHNGNLSELVSRASDIVLKSM